MGIFKKGTKLYSITTFTCPACQESRFFETHPYNLSKVGNTPKTCPSCGHKHEREPGFYYGAMYVSYGLGVATVVTLLVAMLVLFPDMSIHIYVIVIVSGMLLLGPFLYHLSKIIWANMFTTFGEPNLPENSKTEVPAS